ncbi:nuclear transport factor 2 family protein [Novosphingobium sp. JCM 18896]|uniref:nuclear transport factor 2 family protein n=1 Tax=Novosphingobium sp. JCM 18896 TaxID=2989731 RepID=UPI0022213908|nr:nuclear transport factor 2 family protein [Novosphingobium sp. JCM 18896]MCW1432162.1 nuclear transport factor 2 family protein [Novosphingobium sp. JCM 18896]
MNSLTDWNTFARRWCEDWNVHDLDRVLSHFADDVVFTSPVAGQLMPETSGRLIGKAALRGYWEEGLRRISDLRFTVERVFGGVDTVVIQYRNQRSALVSEVLRLRDGKVAEGHGAYEVGFVNPAGLADGAAA